MSLILLPFSPIKATCPQCFVEITTFVQHEMNPFFPISACIIVLIFGYMSLIICPLVYLFTQNAVHRCSRCLITMGIKRCFGLPDDFSAPIWHLKLGKCAVVIARIYALLILVGFTGLSSYYVYQRPYTIHKSMFDKPEGDEPKLISATWTDYL